jgi:hypothetical protein
MTSSISSTDSTGEAPRTRKVTVVAQDPSVRRGERIVMGEVTIPRENLQDGPWGHRVQVIDYDASLDRFRKPRSAEISGDPFKGRDPERLIADPEFRAWSCYAIVMSTLSRFEFALGRRVKWSFGGHQIKVVPHAFADANAFYSKQDESILFGYFQGRKDTVFTCLSHDVIAHETWTRHPPIRRPSTRVLPTSSRCCPSSRCRESWAESSIPPARRTNQRRTRPGVSPFVI